MTVNEEREVFLRTISSYFKKNSNIPLEKEYIYSYLVSHTIKDGYLQGIPRKSLVNVQLHLNEKLKGADAYDPVGSMGGLRPVRPRGAEGGARQLRCHDSFCGAGADRSYLLAPGPAVAH